MSSQFANQNSSPDEGGLAREEAVDASESSQEGSWWSRPCGGRDVLTLALPLMISTGSWSIMHFIDRMFLFWHRQDAMAASMPAGMLHFTMLCLPLGVASYVNTFVAQYHGANRPERIGAAVGQGLRFALYIIPLFLLTIPLAPLFFFGTGNEERIAFQETIYFQVMAFGAGGAIAAEALAAFFTGRGSVRVVMLVTIGSAAINIVLDYWWIFGGLGVPVGGIEGAAWATVAAIWFRPAAFIAIAAYTGDAKKYRLLEGCRFDAPTMKRLLWFGAPSGLQLLVEVSAFTLFIVFLVRPLGELALTATVLAFNVNTLAFIPMLGLGIAVSTLVGQQLGQGRPDLAARATWTAWRMGGSLAAICALFYFFAPDLFLLGFKAGAKPDEYGPVRDLAVVLLRFVAVYFIFDTLMIVFVSAIKGAGDTIFVLIVSAVSAPLPLLAGYIGIERGGGILWCWVVITAWIISFAAIYFVRFLQGKWRTMRVIETSGVVGEEALATDEPTLRHAAFTTTAYDGDEPEPADAAVM